MTPGRMDASSVALKRSLREFLLHRKSDRPISISDMIQRARYALPDLSLSEDELEHVIATEIVASGGNIAFDRKSGDPLKASGR